MPKPETMDSVIAKVLREKPRARRSRAVTDLDRRYWELLEEHKRNGAAHLASALEKIAAGGGAK